MCPDKQILSVYFDGELPERFRRTLEDHLASCEQCGKTLASFRALSAKLFSGESAGAGAEDGRSAYGDGEIIASAKERVWAKLALEEKCSPKRLFGQGGGGRDAGRLFPGRGLWRKRVSVPLPFAAAAGFLLVFAATVLLLGPSRGGQQAVAGKEGLVRVFDGELLYYDGTNGEHPMVPAGTPANMADVLQYLNNSNADVLDIRLPESRNFSSFGEPKLINAANYAGRKTRQ
jgi:hypothetical protein